MRDCCHGEEIKDSERDSITTERVKYRGHKFKVEDNESNIQRKLKPE